MHNYTWTQEHICDHLYILKFKAWGENHLTVELF